SFRIRQSNASLAHGTTVWDGARVLSRFLHKTLGNLKGQKVLELGSGTACLNAMVCAKLGAELVVCTDTSDAGAAPGEVVELARYNLDLNEVMKATVKELDWTWSGLPPEDVRGSDVWALGPYDLILASDTLFSMTLVEPFLGAILRACHQRSVAYIAYEERDPLVVQHFLDVARERGFEVAKVPKAAKFRREG
ncbi:nicotinamide N-methyltransferase-like protein, partial [Hyaloraphidium curvatum]